MPYDDLLTVLRKNPTFASVEEAQTALNTTLETFGYMLPSRLTTELAAALPRSCSSYLQRGRQASDTPRRLAHAMSACMPNELAVAEIERIRAVCAALFGLLPLELMRAIDGALPRPLTGVFERHALTQGAS